MKFPLALLILSQLLAFNCAKAQTFLGYDKLRRFDSLRYIDAVRNGSTKNQRPLSLAINQPSRKKIFGKGNVGQLVNGTATCYDTSERLLLKTNNVNYYVGDYIWSTDGNLLISGEYYNYINDVDGGFLIKADQWGNVSWAKLYDSINAKEYDYFNYYKVVELASGAILLAGATNDPITGNDDVILTKTDNKGNIIWSRTYKSKLWKGNGSGSDSYFYLQDVKEDVETGDLFFSGPHWADGRNITRVSGSDGNVKWSKVYELWGGSDFDRPFGMDITKSEIVSFSKHINYNDLYLNVYRLNKNNGDTIETKFFKHIDTSGYISGILTGDPLVKLSNGHYIVSGATYDSYYHYMWDGITPLYQTTVIEFDNNLNIVNSYSFKNNFQTNGQNTLSVYPDGQGILTIAEYLSSYRSNVYYVQLKDNQILKQRKRLYTEGIPILGYPLQMADKGNISIRLLGDTTDNINKIEFLKLHITDTASDCLGLNDNSFYISKLDYSNSNYGFDSIMSSDFFDAPNKTLTTTNLTLDLLPGCKKISYCDTIKIVPEKDTICVGQPGIFHIRKNAACGATPYFDYDTSGVNLLSQLNDSTYSFQFNNFWHGYIHASIESCIKVKDSTLLTVLAAPKTLNLGPDTTLCPGNTIILNAHSGFSSYKWQDASTDSTFKITQPGKYFVTAINACGDIFSDTINITAHPPIPFNVGSAIALCLGDTATITAPYGFSNYQWAPSYRISATTTRTVKVYPDIDTSYIISAEKTPGCFAYDTIHVNVKQIAPIHLGNDTSFCSGQSITLAAGSGFNSYKWNTGAVTPSINVSSEGSYSISAELNGCTSKDTIAILHVSPLPAFSLGNDTTLCENETLPFHFTLQNANYMWSDGNTSGSYSISHAGSYSLTVSQDGCTKADTISINYKPVPQVYLGSDTTLCETQTLLLDATNINAAYIWQDGSKNAMYLVTTAGEYHVEININDCIARDTIKVVYIPLLKISLGADTTLCKGITYTLEPTINTPANYLWQDGSSQPFFNINTDGIYFLTASNNCGSVSDSIRITTTVCQLQMPNAFTPNSDGRNDIFRVIHPFPVKQFHMIIYNRWGQNVFESSDIYKGWNGTFNNKPLPTGTYVWMISLTDLNNKQQTSKGSVLLIH